MLAFSNETEIITELEKDIQRLISELKMGTTAYNVEAILGKNGKLYILELGARSWWQFNTSDYQNWQQESTWLNM